MRSISISGCSDGVWGFLFFCRPWRIRTVVIPRVLAVAISSVSLSPTHRMWAWGKDIALAAWVSDDSLSLFFRSSCRMRVLSASLK